MGCSSCSAAHTGGSSPVALPRAGRSQSGGLTGVQIRASQRSRGYTRLPPAGCAVMWSAAVPNKAMLGQVVTWQGTGDTFRYKNVEGNTYSPALILPSLSQTDKGSSQESEAS
ncbi:hypothetical protein AAFF_G00111770 [Aldrovandia affinis]|uniref:Uncharacterized protein n=1 Tax=Aldrovandia affinis TaxID=143900 RepID=A0AAD7RTC4_9TELE|nr:hypothetical protein AAFF_G00111770 [Aldrovandia affinis]